MSAKFTTLPHLSIWAVMNLPNSGVVIGAGLTGAERIVTTAAGFLREGEHVSAVPQRESTS